jgi:hypothetical protein
MTARSKFSRDEKVSKLDTRSRAPDPNSLYALLRKFPPVRRRPRGDGWTIAKQRSFIHALMACGNVTAACKSVGMSRESAYLLRYAEGGEGFAEAWEAALTLAAQRLADAAYERVFEGEEIPHFYKGEQVGTRIKYDNRLLMFLLRTQYKRRFGRFADVLSVYECDAQLAARVELAANLETLREADGGSAADDDVAAKDASHKM